MTDMQKSEAAILKTDGRGRVQTPADQPGLEEYKEVLRPAATSGNPISPATFRTPQLGAPSHGGFVAFVNFQGLIAEDVGQPVGIGELPALIIHQIRPEAYPGFPPGPYVIFFNSVGGIMAFDCR